MKNNLVYSLLIIAVGTNFLHAQPPPPPPSPPPAAVGAASNVSGTLSQFNYGAEGRVEGFVLSPNTLVSLPPDWAMQIESLAKRGDRVSVTGALTIGPSGMQIVEAQSLRVGDKNFSITTPSQPAPYAGTGAIRQLNYGPRGEVNGFILQNGVIARTPPFGASDVSVIRPGANISFSGFARVTPAGKTVVEVQSITANGQTIALNSDPGPGPGGPGRGPGRGPGGRGPGGRGPGFGDPPPPSPR